MTYVVRMNCEYSTTIEANSAQEAVAKAEQLPAEEWESQEWSIITTEEF
jgi:hypothetical protein